MSEQKLQKFVRPVAHKRLKTLLMAFLVTGACFVIFNASLKAGGPTVRWSIVEDGVMIQVGLSKGWEK